MALDVFQLRESVVGEYGKYVNSFINIHDDRVREFVEEEMGKGALWPDPALQLNPAYEPDDTLGELAAAGVIREETADFFGRGIRLYRHQRQALDAARRDENYVVSTGTGSGKSLAYLIPVYDHIVRNELYNKIRGVSAVLVYPMNALINSQLRALEEFAEGYPQNKVTFARYTGQTTTEERNEILNNPPHILLTNYVMLEYMLLRPSERSLLANATRDLRFIVMDELHFYRGRQGADVAMLMRRLSRKAKSDVLYVGTSATMVSEGGRARRQAAVAEVARKIFGAEVRPDNVIDETLRRIAQVPAPQSPPELRDAALMPPPANAKDFVNHPLAAWAENTFGLAEEEDEWLTRSKPRTLAEAVAELSAKTGLDERVCDKAIKAILDCGSAALAPGSDEPLFAFRLHQFLASGGNVYATLEGLDSREMRLEGARNLGGEDGERDLFPLSFCRECGQDYYLVERSGDRLVPRAPLGGGESHDGAQIGYFTPDAEGDLWTMRDDGLPEHWFDARRDRRVRLKPDFARHRPERISARPDGTIAGDGEGVAGWFQPSPLTWCMRCNAVYDRHRGREFRKLASLGQIGRSTATTIAVSAGVSAMAAQGVERQEAKALSFTDNRQDASLQAGHLNDFAQTAQIRAGLVAALRKRGELGFEEVGDAIFEALDLQPDEYMEQPVDSGRGLERDRGYAIRILQFRALEDLSRGWRIVQPNLEQAGLLEIKYAGLEELAGDDALWADAPRIGEASADTRVEVLTAFLNHLRTQLAIQANELSGDSIRRLISSSRNTLKEPWSMDENERSGDRMNLALLPGVAKQYGERNALSLSSRSAVARYLRNPQTWGADDYGLDSAESGDAIIGRIVDNLTGHILYVAREKGKARGVRVLANALRWTPGNGKPAAPDPVRARNLRRRRPSPKRNDYFFDLYQKSGGDLKRLLSREHTGQVNQDDRQEREAAFRNGTLPALFCSPTMELGVDIRELQFVHMRNVPPTPANYAQRGGRAGRGGKPALIAAFAGQGSAHDQHFFHNRNEMIAGVVDPARMELRNKDLVESHIHSIWLAASGASLGSSVSDVLELEGDDKYPIKSDLRKQLRRVSRGKAMRDAVLHDAKALIERTPELRNARWYSDKWLEDLVDRSLIDFGKAFEEWRNLYRATLQASQKAYAESVSPSAPSSKRDAAERRQQQARRELNLLLNQTHAYIDSDFYPYRYLASQGFLPGYNFLRLPVRALALRRSSRDTDAIHRPRFLGLAEFGPHNTLYHEGRKHRADAIVVPADGIDSLLSSAKLCRKCGYWHDGADGAEVCENCNVLLDGNIDFPQSLLDMPTVRTTPRERISSEEEERVRSGYDITTHYSFQGERETADIIADGEILGDMTYGQSAQVCRINHGWRSQGDRGGFTLDSQTGQWRQQSNAVSDDDYEADEPDMPQPIDGVKPFVQDTRDILLIKPSRRQSTHPNFMVSLAHALRQGIQLECQVEENEIGAELIGEGEMQSILLWEAAEGGIGVAEMLMEETKALRGVARRALTICHFNPDTGEASGDNPHDCVSACYQCLMSYSNQQEHRRLDRNLIKDFLMRLTSAAAHPKAQGASRDDHYERLLNAIDPASSLERGFIQYIQDNGHILPDKAQYRPTKQVPAQADFYYESKRACVFIDGQSHDSPSQHSKDTTTREDLEDLGFQVIVVRYDSFENQIALYPYVFGRRN